MKQAMDETERRREIQQAYNEAHGVIPQSVVRPVSEGPDEADYRDPEEPHRRTQEEVLEGLSEAELTEKLTAMKTEMREAAKNLDFERAAELRDRVRAYESLSLGLPT